MNSKNKDYDEIVKGRIERRSKSREEWLARKVDRRCETCGEKHEATELFCDVCEEIVDMMHIVHIFDVENGETIAVCNHCELPIPITTIKKLRENGIIDELEKDDDVSVRVDLLKNKITNWVCNLPEGYEIPQDSE